MSITPDQSGDGRHFKDAVLAELSAQTNVAQFVSFGPGDPTLRYSRVRNYDVPDPPPGDAIEALLAMSVDGTVNVRSFLPEQPQSNEFIYGLSSAADAANAVQRLATQGLYTIVNETIDIHDGGVSGVSYAGVVEFAPDDTPRCVERPGTASFPRDIALRLLRNVYGFEPLLEQDPAVRVEFSIHPLRRGYRHEHTIIWERESLETLALEPASHWPNRFSRFIGDKAFGLLVADAIGLHVPQATVVARRVAPFSFGERTDSLEYWIRTAPVEQLPGKLTTQRGWVDPFELLNREDPNGEAIASVLAQQSVDALFSGAAIANPERLTVEGVAGFGDAFMQGSAPPEPLPQTVAVAVRDIYDHASERLGPVRFEWAYDGRRAWVLQLHRGIVPGDELTIYPGASARDHRFDVSDGLEPLRELVANVRGTGEGIVLVGRVGITSHFGDVLRKAQIPSRIEAPELAGTRT